MTQSARSPLDRRSSNVHPQWDRACRALALAALLPVLAAVVSAEPMAEQRNIRFSRLNIEQGLSQSSVECIEQDRLGFIWLCTEDGLNRYDGREIKVFKHDPQDPTSLSENWVSALHEDTAGRLWVGTEGGGLNVFDSSTQSFEQIDLPNRRIRVITEDPAGHLWLGSETGVVRLDPGSRETEAFTSDADDPTSLSDSRVNAILIDSAERVWIGTSNGLNRLDPGTDGFVHYGTSQEHGRTLSDDHVRALLEDRSGRLWIGTYDGGIDRLDLETGEITSFRADANDADSLAAQRVRTLLEDRSGTIWIGTESGLDQFVPETESFLHYRHDPTDIRSLSEDHTRTLFQDRGGVIWVGTQGGGASRWNATTGYFPLYRADSSSANSLSDDFVAAFHEVGDTVWVGTFGGGLNRLDLSTGQFQRFRARTGDPSSLSDDRVMSLLTDSKGALWVGTFTGGLNRLRPDGRSFDHFRHDQNDDSSLSERGVMSLYEDSLGELWLGTFRGGLNRFVRETETFERYHHDPDDPTTLSNDEVSVIIEDRDQSLLIGTRFGGINRFDRRSGTFATAKHDGSRADSLMSDNVTSLLLDDQGRLWIGTDSGLDMWSERDRVEDRAIFTHYTERDGLPNARVWGIVPDDHGHLWISTNNGLSRFDPRTGVFKNYNASHGLQSNEFNFGAYHRGQSGRLYFGGIKGFNHFEPSNVRDNSYAPPVIFTSFRKLNEEAVLDRPIWDKQEIQIEHRDYVVTLSFAALDFTEPALNQYEYKLEGLHDDWVSLGDVPRATFTQLDPGRYTLNVRASNNDGLWNQEGASLRLRVIPPPWRTWWAYGLYALLAGGVLLTYMRSQTLKLQREESYSRELEQQVRERTRDLEEATVTDPLTGLKNRRYLMTHLQADLDEVDAAYFEQRTSASERLADRDLLFMMVDLDGVKRVNDVHGHAAGDSTIVQMRELLEGAVRGSDTIIRLGGDEFLIVGRGFSRAIGEKVAERIRSSVSEHEFDVGGGKVERLTCSIGFAFYPFLATDPQVITGDQVVTIADRALYIAKSSGRNAWVGIHSTSETAAQDLVEMINFRLEPLVRDQAIEIGASLAQDQVRYQREG